MNQSTERAALADRIFDFSRNVKLRVTGADRQRFLNGQITNDIRKANEARAIEACLLDAKGRMTAHVFLFAPTDSFMIDADPALKEALQPRLERYVIADDVTIEDVSDQWSILHVVTEEAPSVAEAKWTVAARRFQRPGWDIWLDPAERENVLARLSDRFHFCDDDCAERARLEEGIPRWGRELTGEIMPVEANLEERCIDYEKGCYLGQEVVSRMKMSGQRNKRLCGLISVEDRPLRAGLRLVAPSEPGKEAGWITSAGRSGAGGEIALGFVKRGFNGPGTRLEALLEGEARPGGLPVAVVDLPFGQ